MVGWQAVKLSEPYDTVFSALVAETVATIPDDIRLARPIMVDNRASGAGAALAAGPALVAMGNGVIARNEGSGAIDVRAIKLSNSTLADNIGGGLAAASGGQVQLLNTILLRNGDFNCKLADPLARAVGSFQFPGDDCGTQVSASDPGLGTGYRPSLISAARGAGDSSTCAVDPLVAGIDLFGRARLERGSCDSGAIEEPLLRSFASSLGLGSDDAAATKLIWLLAVLALLLFLVGLIWAAKRRLRKKAREPAGSRAS